MEKNKKIIIGVIIGVIAVIAVVVSLLSFGVVGSTYVEVENGNGNIKIEYSNEDVEIDVLDNNETASKLSYDVTGDKTIELPSDTKVVSIFYNDDDWSDNKATVRIIHNGETKLDKTDSIFSETVKF